MSKPLIFLLILGLLTSPLYLLPSGSIQVYHAVLSLMSLLVLFKAGGLKANPAVSLVIAFWAYVFIRQSLFIMDNAEAEMATLLYPTLNMGVFLGVYLMLTEVITPRGIKQLLNAVGAVLLFEISYIFIENGSLTFFFQSSVRSIGTFNNPNQLGYFAVLMGCALVAIATVSQVAKWRVVFFVLLAYLLAIISLSKAAMLAIAPLLLFALISWGRGIGSKHLRALVFVTASALLLLLAVIILSQFEGFATSDNEVLRRLALVGRDSDDTLFARGYALILNPDERIIFGYGEGYYKMMFGKEVHSTLANVLTSYGVAGSILFSAMVLYIVRFKFISLQFGLVSLVFAYGLTHNGLRNTLFWVFLAIIAWSAKRVSVAGDKHNVHKPAPNNWMPM